MEVWDIYDALRRPTGRTMLRGEEVAPGDYHVAVHVIIFNRAGQMLIQQRQSCKKAFPDAWDISVGGCAIQGENSQQAAMREVREELGLEIDLHDTPPDLTLAFPGGFDDMYIVEREQEPDALRLQEEEVQAVRWAEREEILKMLRNGEFVTYKPGLIEVLFDLRDHSGGLEE